MQKFRLPLLMAILSLLHHAVIANDSILQHTSSWQATLSKAKQEQKLIFVDCYFTGCHPCAQMDKDVFPVNAVNKELANNFIGIKIDVFKEQLGDTINKKYAVTGYPTFLILSPEGKLISMESGFMDAGLLLDFLENGKNSHKSQKYLAGFSSNISLDYPEFYMKYFDRNSDPLPASTATDWLEQQPSLLEEKAAIAYFMTRKTNPALDDIFLDKYAAFTNGFGDKLSISKVTYILNNKLNKILQNKADETTFRSFMSKAQEKITPQDWPAVQFVIGHNYYAGIAKDTIGFLKFANELPVLYANYMGAFYSNMVVRKQLNNSNLMLLCSWADKAITVQSSFEAIAMAANFHQKLGNNEGQKRFLEMAVQRARKYGLDTQRYNAQLAIVN